QRRQPGDDWHRGGYSLTVTEFRPKLVYVYDALCPWCYAFTPVVQALVQEYQGRFDHEVLSGGMVRGDQVREIGGHEEAARLRESYQSIQSRSEEHTSELQSRENLVCRILLENKK